MSTNNFEPSQGAQFGSGEPPLMLFFLLGLLLLGAGAPGKVELTGIVMTRGTPYTPVAGAEVTLEGTDRKAVSDEAGSFKFPDLTPGVYRLVARKDGAEARGAVNVNTYAPPGVALIMVPAGTTMFGLTPVKTGTVYAALCTREGFGAVGWSSGPPGTTFSYPAMIINEWADFMRENGSLPVDRFAAVTPVTAATDAFMLLPPGDLPLTGYQSTPGTSPVWLAFRPDGQKLYAACSDQRVRYYDPVGLRAQGALDFSGNVITDLTVTPDNKYLALTLLGRSPAVMVVDTATHKELKRYESPVGQAQALVAPDANTLLVVGDNGTIVRMDVTTGTVLGTGQVGKTPTGLAVSGDRVYVVNSGSGDLSVLTYPDLRPAGRVRVGSAPRKVAVAGGRIFVSLYGQNAVAVLGSDGPTLLATPEVGEGPVGLAVAPDDSQVYVACRLGGTVCGLDARTGAVTFRTSPQPMSAPFGLTVHP